MSETHAITGRTFLPDGTIERCTINWRDEEIVSVELADRSVEGAEPDDHLIVPGFVDLHVHGGGGHDFAGGNPESIPEILSAHARGGTSALAATIVSSARDETIRAIEAIVDAEPNDDGAEIAAIHLEGPFLNGEKCGAQNRSALRSPNPEEVEEWVTAADGVPLVVTLAPELEGAIELIETYPEIQFSLGHSAAEYSTSLEAMQAGARRITHLFNAMSPLHHREPGLVGAAILNANILVEIIADGHHIHPAVLQIIARWMPDQAVIVTDAIAAAGTGQRETSLGGLSVMIENRAARLEDGTLAGSVATMRDCLVTMVEQAGVPIEFVLPMMTSRPAHALGIDLKKGSIEPKKDADFLVLDERLQITRRVVRGREA